MLAKMSLQDHVAKFYDTVEELYRPSQKAAGEDGFGFEFQQIKNKANQLKRNTLFGCLTGAEEVNRKKNRYKDILPFDYTRVKLDTTSFEACTDYINASYIKDVDGAKGYIASQGPLPHTVDDFWRMLWGCRVKVVIMVCREVELGKKKCERYWADENDQPKQFGDILVKTESSKENSNGFCVRKLTVQRHGESRQVTQLHYSTWPDHGVPTSRSSILELIREARNLQPYQDTQQPLCVHCSAGCGRTGAILVIDYFRHLLLNQKFTSSIKIFDIVMKMREQRSSIVQTKEQYEYVHLAVFELVTLHMKEQGIQMKETDISRSICAPATYENVELRPPPVTSSLVTSSPLDHDLPSGPPPTKPSRVAPPKPRPGVRTGPVAARPVSTFETSALLMGAPPGGGGARKLSANVPPLQPPPKPALRKSAVASSQSEVTSPLPVKPAASPKPLRAEASAFLASSRDANPTSSAGICDVTMFDYVILITSS